MSATDTVLFDTSSCKLGKRRSQSENLCKITQDCTLREALTHARGNANGQVGKSSHDEAGNAGGSGCGCDERLLGGCLQAAVWPTSVGPFLPRDVCRTRLELDAGLQPCTLFKASQTAVGANLQDAVFAVPPAVGIAAVPEQDYHKAAAALRAGD